MASLILKPDNSSSNWDSNPHYSMLVAGSTCRPAQRQISNFLPYQSFQPPYHFIVLPRAFHSIFFHLIVFFIEKNVFTLVLKIAYSNTRTQAHSQAVVLLVVVLQVRRILLSSHTSSKANYGLCAETGKTAAAMTNFSGFTKPTELLTAVIFGRFAAIFFFNRPYFRTFLKSPYKNTART